MGAITLNELTDRLATLSYPVSLETVDRKLGDTTLQLADGETTIGETLELVGTDRFDSENELESELFGALPRNAVGEPYQSEGEG
ncbi:hypothetical protein Halru_2500 [Halovivax ruber XH-70]|uniref:DUF2795 domain-containing protein n=1 Tax=Halovivax ruber (strain DSM 18193 / JCM 13892 / XH-70) TaxID=797302 RepID=L0IGG8_HALRX|nr:hypothetical protein [Halovivax ruber]AGB17082.1 hypothetical protein Halru_2500 [Halovivax ruber XH-70]